MLAALIECAKQDGKIEGVVPHLMESELSILQYADDTIVFMDHHIEKAKNLKLILPAFEQLSRLKNNFHKSERFCFREAQENVSDYVEKIRIRARSFSNHVFESSDTISEAHKCEIETHRGMPWKTTK